jgi:hypothetical protein
MDDLEFDRALVASAFRTIADHGWHRFSVATAAREAGLPLDRARRRFPCRAAVLLRFGSLADEAALAGATEDGSPRDRLFDILMRRLDAHQTHRAGILALMRALPCDPATTVLLSTATLCSMAWMLEGAGIGVRGLRGLLRAKGLQAAWLATVRSWQHDETDDLAHTMAALDKALSRAERLDAWTGGHRSHPAPHEEAHHDGSSTQPEPPAEQPTSPDAPPL